MSFIGISALIAGCASEELLQTAKSVKEPLVLAPGMNLSYEGVLDFNTVVFAENPTTLLERTDFHAYEFDGRAGGVVTIAQQGKSCGLPDPVLAVFGPENANGNRGASLAESDDAVLGSCFLDAQIRQFRLPVTGTYLVVATSFLQQGGGHYRLTLQCNNNACVPSDALTFARTRIQQTAIDAGQFSPDDLFEIGDFLFDVVYRVENGMGNALAGLPGNGKPRPNFRQIPNNVHFAAFGGPEAQSCVSCHNLGAHYGAGDLAHNTFRIGDGVDRSSGLPRNAPALLGLGLRQRAGEEMTAELHALLAAGRAQAQGAGLNATVILRPPTNPINFGTAIARPDGTFDLTGIRGIDADLVVKPFGWKGQEAKIRRFVESSHRVHFGMQTEASVNNHCRASIVSTFGNGANCQDPDSDGVQKEILDGQLSAQAIHLAALQMPVRIRASSAAAQTRVNQGEQLFNDVGCDGCHRQFVTIKDPRLTERGDTTTGAGTTIDLATMMRRPRPAVMNGSMTIEAWSNFRRQDMGTRLADTKPFGAIGPSTFATPPLWGFRDTAPYLHDGRAKNLFEAVVLHVDDTAANVVSDAWNSVNAFKALTADQQKKIEEFMQTLVLSPTCKEKHGFSELDLSAAVPSDPCPDTMCGLNGMWLGAEVPFRTLHTNPLRANERNLSIIAMRDEAGRPMWFDVINDVLVGRPVNAAADIYLEAGPDWEFDLGVHNTFLEPPEHKYTIHIDDVIRRPFWAQYKPLTDNYDLYTAYVFSAISIQDECHVEVCRPGLAQGEGLPGIEGTAVIFRGDIYDSAKYGVRSSPISENDNDSDTINIACLGTTLSKLHLLRHTAASGRSGLPVVPVPERQTLLKLLAADYCGDGILTTTSNFGFKPFTLNRTPIGISFASNGIFDSYYKLTSESGYLNEGPTDALWNESGARCIQNPRLLNSGQPGPTAEAIQQSCRERAAALGRTDVDKVLPFCSVSPIPGPIRATSKNPSPAVASILQTTP